uniref:Uncharacterized protein n=1 Tax=Knipowitschia caucasica TaxID=637954 RepID=A0AAV2JSV3_KNICA
MSMCVIGSALTYFIWSSGISLKRRVRGTQVCGFKSALFHLQSGGGEEDYPSERHGTFSCGLREMERSRMGLTAPTQLGCAQAERTSCSRRGRVPTIDTEVQRHQELNIRVMQNVVFTSHLLHQLLLHVTLSHRAEEKAFVYIVLCE